MALPAVLLVDDDAPFRAVARALLATWGFNVAGEAGTGREALEAAEALHPAVVILDVQLPDMDGFEISRRLLERPQPPGVVLISSRDADSYGRRIAESGARGFVTKSRLSRATLRAILGLGGEESR